MSDRHTVNTITSDALDALYEQLEAAEETESQRQLTVAREALASATTRAARAEAAVARVRALHRDWDADPGRCAHCQDGMGTPLPWPCPTLRALDGPPPVPAATEATDTTKEN
ncbi:hypothetical protein [Streptomyces sp. NPDC002132]|uniref:hypothetical protein n=1 Tax=unclassified Streptomyces TaxID=2593676 RepID=UPI003325DC96